MYSVFLIGATYWSVFARDAQVGRSQVLREASLQVRDVWKQAANRLHALTVLVERLQGSFHCTDLGFNQFDAEFNALFGGVIFRIEILQNF